MHIVWGTACTHNVRLYYMMTYYLLTKLICQSVHAQLCHGKAQHNNNCLNGLVLPLKMIALLECLTVILGSINLISVLLYYHSESIQLGQNEGEYALCFFLHGLTIDILSFHQGSYQPTCICLLNDMSVQIVHCDRILANVH